MNDRYFRPEEEQKAAAEATLASNFPDLFYGKFELVTNAKMRFAIDDISVSLEPKAKQLVYQMGNACNGGLRILSIADLSRNLSNMMMETRVDVLPEEILVLYPGDGAETVKNALPTNSFTDSPSIIVPARRIRDASGAAAAIDLPFKNTDVTQRMETDPKLLVVVDDVIDSGMTLDALRKKGIYPNSKWIAATPIMISPLSYPERTNIPSSVSGYDEVFAATILQSNEKPFPLNSLSSYIEPGEKADRLIGMCVERFIQDEKNFERFTDAIAQLRREMGYT